QHEPRSVRLVGKASGALGFGSGQGIVRLRPESWGRTRLSYTYRADVGGKVASVGQRLLSTVTRVMIAEFFNAVERTVAPKRSAQMPRWLAMLLAMVRGNRHEAGRVRIHAAAHGRGGSRRAGGAARGGGGARGRHDARPDAQSAHGAAEDGHRHITAIRPRPH